MRFQRYACGFAIAATALYLPSQARADSVADFYKGKSVQMLIGYTVGGGYDLYARVLARHIGKHIPGHPTIIPRNMPGAGSLVLTNWLYNVAPKDGTAFGTIGRGTGFENLFGDPAAKFVADKFNWIGSMNNEVSVCVAWYTSGIKSINDVLKRELVVGGTGPSADTDQFPRVMNAVVGTKFKLISGYPGGNETNLAMERGETQGRCGWSWSSVKSTRWKWYTEKKINVLVQLALEKHPDLPNVPLIVDLAKNKEQRQILNLVFSRQSLGRPFLAPPNLPPERAAALRKAFADTMKDPAFQADAQQAKLEVNWINGEAVAKVMSDATNTDPAIIKKAAAMLVVKKPGKSKKKR